jgi:hypothetical protein
MTPPARPHKGDHIVVHGDRVGESSRAGQILEVLGTPEHERYRIRWEDGHESIFSPGGDVVIRHAEANEDEPVLIHEP